MLEEDIIFFVFSLNADLKFINHTEATVQHLPTAVLIVIRKFMVDKQYYAFVALFNSADYNKGFH